MWVLGDLYCGSCDWLTVELWWLFQILMCYLFQERLAVLDPGSFFQSHYPSKGEGKQGSAAGRIEKEDWLSFAL